MAKPEQYMINMLRAVIRRQKKNGSKSGSETEE